MRKIVLLFLFYLFVSELYAQDLPAIEIDQSYSNIAFDKMAKLLTDQHQIYVFYKTEWVKDVKTPTIERPVLLKNFLNQFLPSAGLHALEFQGNIIIIPGATPSNETELARSSVFVIGNPLDNGKYKKTILSGKVLEGKSKAPIPGAQIYCEELSKAVSSNADGNYQLELPQGKHQIRFSFIGLDDELRDIIIYDNGSIDVELYEETISLNQIDVTAERPEDNYRSTSMGISKLDIQSIKKLSVLMGEADVIKSMIMLPGVQSTGENASGFNVRGGNIDQNLILIQEAPVFNTSHLFGIFSMLDANLVKNVTLYKSGMPSRYGGRLSSVMNIELKKGQQDKMKVNGGIGLINSRLSVEGPIGKKLTFLTGFRSTYSDWMLKMIKNYDLQNSSASFYDFNAKLDYSINPKNRLSVFSYGSNDDFYYHGNAQYGYGSLIGSAQWNHIFNQDNSGNLTINTSYYSADIVDFSEANTEYNLNTTIRQNQLSYYFSSGMIARHKINAGLSAMQYLIEPGKSSPYNEQSAAIPLDIDNEQALEFGLYAEDEFDLLPQLALITGIRYSNFMLTGPDTVNLYIDNSPLNTRTLKGTQDYDTGEISSFYQGLEPRISLRYELQNSSSVKASYNRTRQYIRQISNTASITPADYWKASDQYIKPLIADQIALGYFRNFKNNKFETSLEIYYKRIQNVVDYKNGAQLILNPDLEQVLISGQGRAYGLELLIKKSTGTLTGWLAYTYSRSFRKIDGQFDEGKINNGNWYRSNYDKPHDFTLALNYQISRRFSLSTNFTYSTGRPVTLPEQKYPYGNSEIIIYSDRNKYRLPDYHRLDLSFTYEGSLRKEQKWRSSWTFSIYNLYAHKNTFSIFYEKQKPSPVNHYNSYALFQFSIIGVPVPSFTYNFWF